MIAFNRPHRKHALWWYKYLLYGRYKVWDEITYPFTRLNVYTFDVWELMIYFIPPFTEYVRFYLSNIDYD